MTLHITTKALYHNLSRRYNNDFVDRLNHLVTPSILLTFCMIFLLRLYVASPIHCFENAYEISEWKNYITSYCYIEEKYFISPNTIDFPVDESTRRAQPILYYQWIPVFLLLEALFCMIPHWLWEAFSWNTGLTVRPIAGAIIDVNRQDNKILRKYAKGCSMTSAQNAAAFFIRVLNHNRSTPDKVMGYLPANGFFSTAYVAYKLSNLLFSIGQLMCLNAFFNHPYFLFGLGVARDLINGMSWKMSGTFPRVAYCDFPRREDSTGAAFTGTSQCLLPNNLLHEVMFLAIWFWLVILIAANFLSLVKLLYIILRNSKRVHFIEALLNFKKKEVHPSHSDIPEFVNQLGCDGIVALRILIANSNRYYVSHFAYNLWEQREKLGTSVAKRRPTAIKLPM